MQKKKGFGFFLNLGEYEESADWLDSLTVLQLMRSFIDKKKVF